MPPATVNLLEDGTQPQREIKYDMIVMNKYRQSPEYKAAMEEQRARHAQTSGRRLSDLTDAERERTRRVLRGILSHEGTDKVLKFVDNYIPPEKRIYLHTEDVANKIHNRQTSYCVLGIETCPWKIFDEVLCRLYENREAPFDPPQIIKPNVQLLHEMMLKGNAGSWGAAMARMELVPTNARGGVWHAIALRFKEVLHVMQIESVNHEFQGELTTDNNTMLRVLRDKLHG